MVFPRRDQFTPPGGCPAALPRCISVNGRINDLPPSRICKQFMASCKSSKAKITQLQTTPTQSWNPLEQRPKGENPNPNKTATLTAELHATTSVSAWIRHGRANGQGGTICASVAQDDGNETSEIPAWKVKKHLETTKSNNFLVGSIRFVLLHLSLPFLI